MHGVILAGGLGTRMGLYTKRIGNKHLMPIYDKIMIEFPICTLVESGITNITIVTGNRYSGQFVDLLGDGKEWGIKKINYAYQFGEGGIADALKCAESSVPKDEPICVILGDNVFEDRFNSTIDSFDLYCKTGKPAANIFLKEVEDSSQFGIIDFDDNGRIVNIIEKPKNGLNKKGHAVVGLYMYSYDVFKKIESLTPSDRKELEVTDLNKLYMKDESLAYNMVNGFWSDAGTLDSLLKCSNWCKLQADK